MRVLHHGHLRPRQTLTMRDNADLFPLGKSAPARYAAQERMHLRVDMAWIEGGWDGRWALGEIGWRASQAHGVPSYW
jgi:hypothetical protein